MDIRQIAMTKHARGLSVTRFQQHNIRHQSAHITFQAFPLRGGKLVGANQADANGFAVKPFSMCTDFVEVPANSDRSIGINDELITNGGKIRVLSLPNSAERLNSRLRCHWSISSAETCFPLGVAEQWMIMLLISLVIPPSIGQYA
ncbi:hypothetical protein SAMN05421755_100729 [Nitrosomonas sp. Nm33]|nr:hypothetical protein SAMN05421755_100729 [Nitrosomonas sp. Nm33]